MQALLEIVICGMGDVAMAHISMPVSLGKVTAVIIGLPVSLRSTRKGAFTKQKKNRKTTKRVEENYPVDTPVMLNTSSPAEATDRALL